ncbi:MAG: sel1 repeat family protein [Candidatus Tectomicrobia bacterium]|uniref:Sel1 repeat family protein n=1 Tax=Tectimicrobiota bacterium TaxID=2528274 RepID=A0A937W3A1_UNCTE|nr:sel1 repeat family protein [Candidatus Tectomicrobia bacterium]
MASRHTRSAPPRLSPLRLALLCTLLLAGVALLPRATAHSGLAAALWGAVGVLLLCQGLLYRQIARTGRLLHYTYVARPVHYVQPLLQGCIYAYWGWYWPEVYPYMPLIIAQLLFAYVLDMLVCWWRRDTWLLSFGPVPITLSTNLFLWFKDEWFFLQFLLVAVGVLGKEFIKWTRDGRRTHIFNPSALTLFLFSLGLIATQSTSSISWAEEVATTLTRPTHIYLQIFLVGLVVQALFSVTLMTLAAATALYIMNLLYTGSTGLYYFVDTNIPAAVFLGLHLLVTDPATSPRTTFGKLVLGGMYGASVFGLYGLLGWLGAPRFYDKLLCVPVLNLSVRWLDRLGLALAAWSSALPVTRFTWSLRQQNLVHMAVWAVLFGVMLTTGFLSKAHPGRDPAFWRQACEAGEAASCQTWIRMLSGVCNRDVATACDELGQAFHEGRLVPRAPREAGISLGRACDLGLREGCIHLQSFVQGDGEGVLQQACQGRDGASCLILGSLHAHGLGVRQDAARAVTLFHQACTYGSAFGCGQLGASHVRGEGTVVDYAKAIASFEQGCRGQHALSCAHAATMYRRGLAGAADEARARQRFQQACALGLQSACPGATGSPVAGRTPGL